MNPIYTYLSITLKYVLIGLLPYIGIRFLCSLKKESSLKKEVAYISLYIYILVLISLTILISLPKGVSKDINTRINTETFRVFIDSFRLLRQGNYSYFLKNLLGNIILFIPLGILLPLNNNKFRAFSTVFIGFVFSFVIESFQLLLMRATDVDDILLNTLGTLAGYLIYKIYLKFSKY